MTGWGNKSFQKIDYIRNDKTNLKTNAHPKNLNIRWTSQCLDGWSPELNPQAVYVSPVSCSRPGMSS